MLLPSGVQELLSLKLLLLILVFLAILPLLYNHFFRSSKTQLPLPPSPPGNWLLGNLRQVLAAVTLSHQHLLFNTWARQYGEIVRVRSGPFVQYLINSDRAVEELFDRNPVFTSQRPRWIASNEQICNRLNVLLLDADDPRWKHQRKVTQNYLTSVPRADAGLPFLHYESAKFLADMAAEEDVTSVSGWKLYRRISRYTHSTFASQTFGMDIPNDDDQVIADIHETRLAQIPQTLPGANVVDVFPFLDHLPLALKPWERRNRARFERNMHFVKEKLQRIHQLRAQGQTSDAFLPLIELENKGSEFGHGIDEAVYLSLMLVIGAADTSAVSTWSFMEAMLLFPDVQVKARKLITDLVGNRIPNYGDIDQIPYIRCLMKETSCRVGPPAHYNERTDKFIPERYAHDTTTTMQSVNAKDVRDRDHFAFGAGRRICPGYHVAERSLAVAIMRILWAFEIVPSADAVFPLNPSTFEGGMMPGVADRRMPVSLKVISNERKLDIHRSIDEAAGTRRSMEPLVVRETGQGAFEKLSFVKREDH